MIQAQPMPTPATIPPQPVRPTSPSEIDKPDRLTKTKSLYDVSYGDLVMRNFLAGLSRALGGIILYLIMVAISGYIVLLYVWPQVSPYLKSYQNLMNAVGGGGIQSLPRFDLPANK